MLFRLSGLSLRLLNSWCAGSKDLPLQQYYAGVVVKIEWSGTYRAEHRVESLKHRDKSHLLVSLKLINEIGFIKVDMNKLQPNHIQRLHEQ